jgi:C1A family cysteine protease
MIKKLILWIVKKLPTKTDKHKSLISNTKKSKKDERDFVATVTPVESIPSTFMLQGIPPIKNQGSIGSCRSHSIIREYEIQLNTKHLSIGKFDGSELFHYYMTRKYINNTLPKDLGMTMRDGCASALKFGICAEALHPYVTANFNKEPDFWAKGMAELFKVKRYERLSTPDQVKLSLLEGVPVGIGVWCDQDLFNYKSGVWNPQVKGNKGGHAVTVVGWTPEGFIIDNSWGISWGKRGQFIMSYEAFNKFSFDWYRLIL